MFKFHDIVYMLFNSVLSPKYLIKIGDLTRMVILYEFYEMSLRRVSGIVYEITTSVRFCLWYDPLKITFYRLKMNIISKRKRIVDTDVVIDVMCMRQSVITREINDFYDATLSIDSIILHFYLASLYHVLFQ